MKKERISITLSPDVWEAGKAYSQQTKPRKSFSFVVEEALIKFLKNI